MKKYILILSVLALCGCNAEKEPTNPVNDVPPNDDGDITTKTRIHEIGEAKTEGYNKVDECLFDFDADGEDDKVELLTTAQVEKGEVHRDDGQNWMVTVTTEKGVFTLFDEYIQLGDIEVDVGEIYNEETEPIIIITQTTGTGKSVTHYTFIDGVFEEQIVYFTEQFSLHGANIVGSMK